MPPPQTDAMLSQLHAAGWHIRLSALGNVYSATLTHPDYLPISISTFSAPVSLERAYRKAVYFMATAAEAKS